jgi:signal transduction histidine kinase
MENLLYFFEHKIKDEGAFQNRRRSFFARISLIALFALMVFIAGHVFKGKYYSALIDIVAVAIIVGNLFFYKFYGRYYLSMGIFMAVGLLTVGVQHMVVPDFLQSNMLWFPLWAFGVNFLFKKEIVKYGISVVVIVAVISEIVHYSGVININEFTRMDAMRMNITSIVLAIISSFYVGKMVMATEREALDSLEQKSKESTQLSEEYAALVAILSHDLSNHISIISLQVKLLIKKSLKEQPVDKESSEYKGLERINRVSDEMVNLITQIKHYKANEDGKIEVVLAPVDPVMAINSSIEYFREKVTEKDLILYFVPPRKVSRIQAESVSLVSSVLNNILTNAIKFSNPKSEIIIRIIEEKNCIKIRISDQGVGIPEEILKDLFDGKKATSRTGTNGEPGTGFGMPILKMYMDKYEGSVEVASSTEGKTGTIFTLVFKKV